MSRALRAVNALSVGRFRWHPIDGSEQWRIDFGSQFQQLDSLRKSLMALPGGDLSFNDGKA